MSKVKRMLEVGAKHYRESSTNLFKLGDNEKVLMAISAWDDVDEPPRWLMKRTPKGRKIVTDESTLLPDDKTSWMYAYPVFTSNQGWAVLIGGFGRNSLLSKIMTLLEALGDYEAPFSIHRKGQGLETEYYVYPANTLFKSEEVERFLKDMQEKMDLKPSSKEASEMVERIFSEDTED